MKGAIAIGLLCASCGNAIAQNETASNSFETFADWCLNQDRLSPEAQLTVEALLTRARTQDCNQAGAVLTNLTQLTFYVLTLPPEFSCQRLRDRDRLLSRLAVFQA
ncbi:MAG: hypothetical protein AAFY67_09895, partial [Cyanobacteria bacterium J06642_9]